MSVWRRADRRVRPNSTSATFLCDSINHRSVSQSVIFVRAQYGEDEQLKLYQKISQRVIMLRRGLTCLLVCALCSCVATIYMLRYRTGDFNGDKRALSLERRSTQPSKLTLVTAASTISGPPPVPCDSECRRFQRLMAGWPRDKPKAALVYLVHRIEYLVPSIKSVSDFFCRKFDYPIVIFHEAGPFSSPGTRSRVLIAAAWNSSHVFFQQVEFKLPTFLTKPVLAKNNCPGTTGYRHMCRFQAKGKYSFCTPFTHIMSNTSACVSSRKRSVLIQLDPRL